MQLIGFAGIAGSGKDTAGHVFQDHGYLTMKFAEPLKEMLSLLLKQRGCVNPLLYIEGEQKEGPTHLLMGRSPRDVMRTLGTEWGRNMVHPDLWTDTLKYRAQVAIEGGRSVCVTDVRHQNEVDAIRNLGGHVIRITRKGLVPKDHPSETGIADLKVDGDLANDCTSARDFMIEVENRFF